MPHPRKCKFSANQWLAAQVIIVESWASNILEFLLRKPSTIQYDIVLINHYPSFLPLHSATIVVPLSIHVAMLGVFMFLNGIATGGLDNGMMLCCIPQNFISLCTHTHTLYYNNILHVYTLSLHVDAPPPSHHSLQPLVVFSREISFK